MGPLQTPFRLLGRRRNMTVEDKEQQGKRGQGQGGPAGVLTLQECESLQLALENELRSPRDQQIVEEQASRFWGNNDVAILGMVAFTSGECADTDSTTSSRPSSPFTMYFRDNTPTVNFEEESDNSSLLMGSLREDDLPEEGQQAFGGDQTSLLNKSSSLSSFGGGSIIGYDLDTVDPGGLGYETSSTELDECCTVWTSPPDQGMYSIVRPTDSDVVAALLKQEASQPNSPRYQNLPPDLYGIRRSESAWKTRKHDKLLAQKEAAAQRRVEAKGIKRDLLKKEFKHHMFSTAGLETVTESSFEDEQTTAGSGKSKSKFKSRPRPPAIETIDLDLVYEEYSDENSESDVSLTAGTGSSGSPILEESRPRPSTAVNNALYPHDKDDDDSDFDMSRTVSTGASSGDPILDEVDLMNNMISKITV
jgi:hypothetical protein